MTSIFLRDFLFFSYSKCPTTLSLSLSPETSFSIPRAIFPFPRLLPLLNSIVDRFFPFFLLSNILHKRLHFNLSRYSRLTSFLLILSFIKFLSFPPLLYSFRPFSFAYLYTSIYISSFSDDSMIFLFFSLYTFDVMLLF